MFKKTIVVFAALASFNTFTQADEEVDKLMRNSCKSAVVRKAPKTEQQMAAFEENCSKFISADDIAVVKAVPRKTMTVQQQQAEDDAFEARRREVYAGWDRLRAKQAAEAQQAVRPMDSARAYYSSNGSFVVYDRNGNKIFETMPTYRSKK